MEAFSYRASLLYCDSVSLEKVAKTHGTPCYVYSARKIQEQCREMKAAFAEYPTLLCYAVKANSTAGVLKKIFKEGFGADIVSGGELLRALQAGAKSDQIIFSGVGKQDWELELALKKGILAFNVESFFELERLSQIAKSRRKKAPIFIRCNPNIDAQTNPYISTGIYGTKFGIAETELEQAVQETHRLPGLELVGLGCHLGSQITDLDVFSKLSERLCDLAEEVRNSTPSLRYLDLGGGLAVRYSDENPPSFSDYARALLSNVKATDLKLVLEPGRILVAEAGGLLTRVIGIKSTPEKTFAVVDAGMNDLIRPCLYEAYHPIQAVRARPGSPVKVDIVGPVCETADFLGLDRSLPPLQAGDLCLVRLAGAYGSVMGSHYNSRPRPPEVLIDGNRTQTIRSRETQKMLTQCEKS